MLLGGLSVLMGAAFLVVLALKPFLPVDWYRKDLDWTHIATALFYGLVWLGAGIGLLKFNNAVRIFAIFFLCILPMVNIIVTSVMATWALWPIDGPRAALFRPGIIFTLLALGVCLLLLRFLTSKTVIALFKRPDKTPGKPG